MNVFQSMLLLARLCSSLGPHYSTNFSVSTNPCLSHHRVFVHTLP